MATNFRKILEALASADVKFVVVGGVALVARGAPRTTEDLDICYERGDENLIRLASALAPIAPYLRDAPAGLPFFLDASTLKAGLNFTLTTTAGDLDLCVGEDARSTACPTNGALHEVLLASGRIASA